MKSRMRKVREENRTILILSQDEGGVYDYLRQTFDTNDTTGGVVLRVRPSGESSRTMFRRAKLSLRGDDRYLPKADYVFLVFDRDNDPHFNGVLNEVQVANLIEALPSVPCFEFFFLLHFRETRQAMAGPGDAISALKAYEAFARYDKSRAAVPVAALLERQGEALKRCARIRDACVADGSKGPVTFVDLLFLAEQIAREHGLSGLMQTKESRLPNDVVCQG